MKIREIRCTGLRERRPRVGWSKELKPEDCVHTLIVIHTDEGLFGLGSVFSNDQFVRAAVKVIEPLVYRVINPAAPPPMRAIIF